MILWMQTFLVVFASFSCFSVSIVSGFAFLSSNEQSITFNASSLEHCSVVEVKLIAKHNASETYSCFKSLQSSDKKISCFEKMKPNTVYNAKARCIGDVNFGKSIAARTAPGKANMKSHFASPTFVVLFLEEVPGATAWLVRFHIFNKYLQDLYAPNKEITNSQFAIVVPNLNGNQDYGAQARVFEVLNTTTYTTGSDFPVVYKFTTAKRRAFARVILSNIPYSMNVTFDDVRKKLLEQYDISSGVEEIVVLELEEYGGMTLCHYELLLKVGNEAISKLQIKSSAEFQHSQVQYNVAGTQAYSYTSTSSGVVNLSSHLPQLPNCGWKDRRSWLFHSNNGGVIKFKFPTRSGQDSPQTKTTIHFNQAQVSFYDGEDLVGSVNLTHNTVYAIQHNYLIKYCPSTIQNITFYDRIYTANGTTDKAYAYTIIYTTGPDAMKNTSDFITAYNITSSRYGSRVEFSFKPVLRASRYDFYVHDDTGKSVDNLTLNEWEIDSSKRYLVRTKLELKWFVLHEVVMHVTTRLANASTATSPASRFFVYTGYPNKTTCRVVEVYSRRFTVEWAPSLYTEGYILKVERHSASTTYNITKENLRFVVNKGVEPGKIYNVSVASHNLFGRSEFCNIKRTKFWSFSDIQPDSFRISWQGEPSDVSYRVAVNASVGPPVVTTNTQLTLRGLIEGALHQVLVEYSDVNGLWKVLFQAVQMTAPARVEGLLQTFRNLTAFGVVWNEDANNMFYEIEVKNLTHGLSSTIYSSTTKTARLTLSGLTSGSLYSVSVRVISSAGAGDYRSLNVTTDKDTPVISGTSEVEASSFKLDWQAAKDAASYVVYVNDEDNQTSPFEVTATSKVLRDLEPGNTYMVFVVAIYPTGQSAQSNSVSQITVPAPPSELNITLSSKKRNIRFQWQSVKGASSFYLSLSSPQIRKVSVVLGSTHYDVTDVFADTYYNVSVLSSNSAGNSSERHKQIFTGYFLPEDISVHNVSIRSIFISWKMIKGAVKYEIGVIENYKMESSSKLASRSDNLLVTGLKPGTRYELNITAVYTTGRSKETRPTYLYTASENPPNISILNMTNSSFTIKWAEPQRAGPVEYRLALKYPGNSSVIRENVTSKVNYTLSRLDAGATYVIEIVTVTYFTFLKHRSYKTLQVPTQLKITTAPKSPQNLTTENFQDKNVTVRWSSSRGAEMYKVFVTATKPEAHVTKLYATKEESLHIYDLEPEATSYSVTVRAVNIHGYESEDASPVLLSVNTENPRSWITINWWILLVASSVAFILFVAMVAWVTMVRPRLREKGVYVLYDDGNNTVEIVDDSTPTSVESQALPTPPVVHSDLYANAGRQVRSCNAAEQPECRSSPSNSAVTPEQDNSSETATPHSSHDATSLCSVVNEPKLINAMLLESAANIEASVVKLPDSANSTKHEGDKSEFIDTSSTETLSPPMQENCEKVPTPDKTGEIMNETNVVADPQSTSRLQQNSSTKPDELPETDESNDTSKEIICDSSNRESIGVSAFEAFLETMTVHVPIPIDDYDDNPAETDMVCVTSQSQSAREAKVAENKECSTTKMQPPTTESESKEGILETGNRESIGLGRLQAMVDTLKVVDFAEDSDVLNREKEKLEEISLFDDDDDDPLSRGPISMLWFDCCGEPGEIDISDRDEILHDGTFAL